MRKPEDIQTALGNIGDDLIEDAAHATATKKRAFAKRKWIPIIAATLVFAILIGVFLQPQEDLLLMDAPHLNSAANANPKDSLHIVAEYPLSTSHYLLYETNSKEYKGAQIAWNQYRQEQKALFDNANLELNSFFNATMQEMLTNSNGENKVYSPINVYLALSMLAEITDGNSREQILELLDVEDVETLRTQVNALWRSHYTDDGVSTLLLGNSFWLNENEAYHEETLKKLAEYYFASSHEGNPMDEEYVQLYRDWINEQTKGLLKNDIDNLRFSKNMLMTLVSTIYFKAGWGEEFHTTKNDTFHTQNGDITAAFMKQTYNGLYYCGELFSAVPYSFQDAGQMWLILPNEGVEMDAVICSAEYQEFMRDPWSKCSMYTISLSLPKFDVSCKTNLIQVMKSLGITDVFDPESADFSPLTDRPGALVTKAEHNARVKIDKEGCEGVAYTIIEVSTESVGPRYPRVDFKLDRPFLFVVASQHNVPLFSGVVNDPTAS